MPSIIKKTISQIFLERVRATPLAIGFQFKPTYSEIGTVGQWKTVTFKEFLDEVQLVASGLISLGIRPSDKVAILSNTRYEWPVCDMAIMGALGVTVPIYAANTADDVIHILNHSEAQIVIAEDLRQLQKLLQKRVENPDCLKFLKKIIVIEPSAMRSSGASMEALKDVMTLQAVKELGRRAEAKDPGKVQKNLEAIQPSDILTICYTSGTTGTPKGVILTHANMVSVLEDCLSVFGRHLKSEKEVVVSFLPFSHIFGRLESFATHTFGWKQVFAENLEHLIDNIQEARPTLLVAVPRTFEKVYDAVQSARVGLPPMKKKMYDWAMAVGRKYFSPIWDGGSPSLHDRAQYQIAKKMVFDGIAQRFGGKLRFAVCGGAPFSKEIGEFFQIIGIEILEGYGLTETSAPVSVNTPENSKLGTAGKPFPEVSIRIAEDGEILLKSQKVFQGYYKEPELTAEVLKDGWFYTGDIGYLDPEGYLHITERKKDMIITSGGKTIAPQKIENLAKAHPLISQFVVLGDGHKYLTALVVLNRAQVTQLANDNQILFSEYSALVKHPKIIARVEKVIDQVNQQLGTFETVKKFLILAEDFTVETGELTPSLKVKRSFISRKYKAELDALYR